MMKKIVTYEEDVSVMYWCCREGGDRLKIDYFDTSRKTVERKAAKLTKKDGRLRSVYKIKLLQEYEAPQSIFDQYDVLVTEYHTRTGGRG